MYYHTFLTAIKDLILEKWITVPWDEFEQNSIWQYIVYYFSEHKNAIEDIMKLWYSPDNCFLRETLSGDYPIIYFNDNETFLKSYGSWKSDLIPSVTFSMRNSEENGKLGEDLLLRIEFGDSGLAGLD